VRKEFGSPHFKPSEGTSSVKKQVIGISPTVEMHASGGSIEP
jgi:hypothetical protein